MFYFTVRYIGSISIPGSLDIQTVFLNGGAWGDRTPGLKIANLALSQLS